MVRIEQPQFLVRFVLLHRYFSVLYFEVRCLSFFSFFLAFVFYVFLRFTLMITLLYLQIFLIYKFRQQFVIVDGKFIFVSNLNLYVRTIMRLYS